MRLDDLRTLTEVLAERSFTLPEIWKENRWVAHLVPLPLIGKATAAGNAMATAFVVRNGAGHELDVHVLTFDANANGIPAWNADVLYSADALAGRGVIAGTPVRCLAAQMQMAMHTDYTLQAKGIQDLRLLHERFGIGYLAE